MSKRITKRNLGGVSLTSQKKDVPKQEIIDYFLQNSDFRILTDTSVSCVNYVATLHADKESPFFSVRSGHFREPVRSLLMKVCIHNTEKQYLPDFRNPNNTKKIESMTPEDINTEAKIQDDIFRKSYIENIAEPICPAILYTQTDIMTDDLQKKYKKWIIPRLIERNPNENPGRDHHITHFLFDNYFLSIIFMEVAEGYYSLFDLWVHPQNQEPHILLILQNLLFMAMYELYQLYHKYGIVHGDIHFGNILVNPSYISNPNGESPGKALLIDFGKSFYETPDPNKQEYDTVIYHQNTHQFENLLQGLSNKNDFFRNNFQDTTELRKRNTQAFLDRLFQGSIERWRDWSKNNIHFPYNDYQVGGLLNNKRKSLLSKQKQTKTIAYNKKKTNMEIYHFNGMVEKMIQCFIYLKRRFVLHKKQLINMQQN